MNLNNSFPSRPFRDPEQKRAASHTARPLTLLARATLAVLSGVICIRQFKISLCGNSMFLQTRVEILSLILQQVVGTVLWTFLYLGKHLGLEAAVKSDSSGSFGQVKLLQEEPSGFGTKAIPKRQIASPGITLTV
ncbi:hypothetical protein BTVI_20254 [Pitangus sulphuratus]|nr:hypothetical protein BTVI_20254 [Pitangus sulphuratus]